MFLMSKWMPKIDFDHLLTVIIDRSFKIVLIFIIYYIIRKFGEFLINRTFRRYIAKSHMDSNRLLTIEKLTLNLYYYTSFFFLAYSLLSTVGVPVGSLLAGAGIAGVAIGLAAQGFINDFITGFFIILERQIEVGDYVTIGTIEGTVEAVGLRTLQIKSPNGILNFIPNRTVTIIRNSSREDMRVLIDIRVKPNIDVQKATDILNKINDEKQEEYKNEITQQPTVIGLTQLNSSTFVLRTQMFVKNGAQYRLQSDFLEFYLTALKQANIEVDSTPTYLAPPQV